MRESTHSCCPGRLRKGARYRTLADGAHAACAARKISSEIKGERGDNKDGGHGDLQVSNYMRGEGDLGGTAAPLV